jgi:hypothetical protein
MFSIERLQKGHVIAVTLNRLDLATTTASAYAKLADDKKAIIRNNENGDIVRIVKSVD